ncbi:hypothetical protein [Salipaludibacillus aurantiacus]|uniref:hypothetical protein n=1 Tax=Salipaludibacillus aurantiacus TaxID=1601833 RepID=UPI0015A514F3|nr:hypothetical protein [Salipaludibacillus aurantiacus]
MITIRKVNFSILIISVIAALSAIASGNFWLYVLWALSAVIGALHLASYDKHSVKVYFWLAFFLVSLGLLYQLFLS